MARDNLNRTIGIGWNADPDPDVFEYLIYWKVTDGDDPTWLANIDDGRVNANATVDAPATEFLFNGRVPNGADIAVVSHSRNAGSGLERWSTPYFPAEFQDIPLDQSAPELAGPSGGRLIFAS